MSYNEPTWPNQGPYYQQSFQAPPPPLQKKTLLERYRSLSNNKKAGVGCLVLIPVLLLCSLCTFVVNVSANQQNQATAPTPTRTAQVVRQNTTTPSPHTIPTAQPTPTAKPKPKPTQPPVAVQPTKPPAKKPTPTPNPCPNAVNHNPWCYDFNPGNVITNPPAGFCSYFLCISSFYDGKGYVIECTDGMYSKSGGRQGSCSKHGGDSRILYSH